MLAITIPSTTTNLKHRQVIATFVLHPQLADNTFYIGDLSLSRILLMNDVRYPWCLLVPRIAGVTEIYQLEKSARSQLIEESCCLARAMHALFVNGKMNIAALGNVVPQLHIHHVVRYTWDAAWPKPVWGIGEPRIYTEEQARLMQASIREALSPHIL